MGYIYILQSLAVCMVRTYTEVPKRARNAIIANLNKLVKKYGEKSVRLVAMKSFEKSAKQRKFEEQIENAEEELKRLKGKARQ